MLVPSIGRGCRRSALLALCAIAVPPAASAAETAFGQVQVPAVSAAHAAVRDFERRVPASGSIIAKSEVLVSPDISGYPVTEILVEAGDVVAPGDLLARIDSRELASVETSASAELARAEAAVHQAESHVRSAEAALEQARRLFDRTRALAERGTASGAAREDTESGLASAEAALAGARDGVRVARAARQVAETTAARARRDLEAADVRAAHGGLVVERSARLGGIASSTTPLFRIVLGGEMELAAEVVETELAAVSPGDRATVEVAGLAPIEGEVRRVSPVVDAGTRLGEVRISLSETGNLRPGLFARAAILAESRRELALPETAILRGPGAEHVLVIGKDGVLVRRDIETGLVDGRFVEIVSGLEPGETVVARAGSFYGSGDQVRVLEPEARP